MGAPGQRGPGASSSGTYPRNTRVAIPDPVAPVGGSGARLDSALMHEIERHGDVTRVRLWSRIGAAAGYDVSVYLTRGVLIDTGFPHAAAEMRGLVREVGVQGAIVTHWHEDHAGNAGHVAHLGVPLDLAAETVAMLRTRPSIRFYRRAVWGRPPHFPAMFERFEHPELRRVPTPGHSDDHHVVWDAERETVFSGDLWLGVRSRVMHEHEEPHRIVESLKRVAALAPRQMFDAHRGPVVDPKRAIAARVAYLEDRIGEIERRVREGWTDRAIVRLVLDGEESVARFSFGEYARTNFVRAVRRHIDRR
jgi:endoribonuclease LACTB2